MTAVALLQRRLHVLGAKKLVPALGGLTDRIG